MLNFKQRTTYIIIAFFMILLFIMPVYGIVGTTSNFYVNDYAGILSNSTEEHIVQKNVNLQSQTGAQIVVVTVPNLEGKDIESYGTELFREFEIGDKTKNNGLLLLLALEEREFRVEVGYGLEGRLPDAKTGRFQDEYIIPYMRNNNWDEGLLNGFNAFYKEVCEEYGISSEDVVVNSVGQSEGMEVPGIVILIIIIIIIIIIIRKGPGGFIFIGGPHIGGSHGRSGSFGGGGFGGFSGGGGSSGGGRKFKKILKMG
jgi:uncharacterized protein